MKTKHSIGLFLRAAFALAVVALIIWKFDELKNVDIRNLVDSSQNALAAVLTILGLYFVKGITFVVPASLVYVAVGMAFSPWQALTINLAGILIEILVSYFAGVVLGGEFVTEKLSKNKYGAKILSLQNNKKNSAIFAVRFLPVFPIDLVSLFLGAVRMKMLPYILVSLGGIMPRVILFTLLGDGIYDLIPMKLIIPVAAALIVIALIFWIVRYIINARRAEKPVYIPLSQSGNGVIFDTDMGPDCDDAGAWAMLLKYSKKYNFRILGAANCTSNDYANGAIRAVAEYFGMKEILIGQHRGEKILPDGLKYNKEVTKKYFDNPKKACESLDEVEFYKKALSGEENKSVTVVTVGTFSNIAKILEKEPRLFNSKVCNIVAMAGKYPEGKEFNITSDIAAAQTVLAKFKNNIIFSDFDIGFPVESGYISECENNPVYDCYRLYSDKRNPPFLRSSWDLTAVHFAVEGENEFYKISAPMSVDIDNEGCMLAKKCARSNRYFLKRISSADELANFLNDTVFSN